MIISVQPARFSPAFNPMPVGIYIEPNNAVENYVVNTNIVYQANSIYQIIADSETTALIEFNDPLGYVVGDDIFLYDRTTTNSEYTGYYTVLEIIDDFTIKVNLTISIPFPITTGFTDTSYTYLYIKYPMEPNPQSFVNLDIHNTIKDFVGTSFLSDIGSYDIGGVEAFQYGLIFGEEYNFVYNFYDNGTVGGNLALLNNVYTNVNQVPFKVGDTINIQQDKQEWAYDDNYFNVLPDGSLGFVSTTDFHNFQVGDPIFVTGQSTYPQSNGYAIVIDVPDNQHLTVNKTFPGSTPAEPGFIYGSPTPQYDGIATITDIYYDAGLSVMVIVTDKIHNESTQPIWGTARLTNNRKFGNLAVETAGITFVEGGKPAYNYAHICRFDRLHYSINSTGSYDTGLLQSHYILGSTNSNWSTILPQDNPGKPQVWNNISKDSPGFILFRQNVFNTPSPIDAAFVMYTCYDKSNTLIGQFYLDLDGLVKAFGANNYYAPISLDRIISFGEYYDLGGFDLISQYLNIYSFTMRVYCDVSSSGYPTSGNEISTIIRFVIDQECSGLPTYHLTWLDSFGSYITYPFKYNAVQSTDVKRNNYYKNEFEWTNVASPGRPPFPPQYVSGYNSLDSYRGENTYNVQARTKIQLTSGWLKDNENIIFEDLMKSADLYISTYDINMSKETTIPGALFTYAAQLEPNNIEYKSNYAGDFIFNYSPIVRFAFNDYRYNNWNSIKLQRGGGKGK